MELSCFFYGPTDVCNLISGSSAFFKPTFNVWNFLVDILLKPGMEDFEHYFTSVWDECNCVVVWSFFGIAFLWDWNENWPFPVLWPLLSFPNLLAALISYASKVTLKILQVRLQQYLNCELPDIQARSTKGRGTRDQIANIHWLIEKQISANRFPEKHQLLLYWLHQNLWLCGSQQTGKF